MLRKDFAIELIIGTIGLLTLTACANKQPAYLAIIEHQAGAIRQLYSVSADGTSKRLLFELPAADDLYWLSPGSNRMAVLHRDMLSQSSEMTIYDLETGQSLGSVQDVGQFKFDEIPYIENISWSPDGEALVFMRLSAGTQGTDLWLYKIDSAETYPFTQDEAIDRAPSWSPDAQDIAFASHPICQSSAWDCMSEEDYWQIVTIKADGSERRIIVDMKSAALPQQSTVPPYRRSLCNLAWSPNMQYILFADGCRPYGPQTYKELYVIEATGESLHQLTNYSYREQEIFAISYSWLWLPNSSGIRLVYSRGLIWRESPEPTWNAVALRIEGEDFASVTEINLPIMNSILDASWSPDGRFLAGFPLSPDRSMFIIELLDDSARILDISKELPVGNCETPQWSPDGQYLAYSTTDQADSVDCLSASSSSVIVVDLPAGQVLDLTQELGGFNRLVGWLPAGKH